MFSVGSFKRSRFQYLREKVMNKNPHV
jgi:hypothetical protein